MKRVILIITIFLFSTKILIAEEIIQKKLTLEDCLQTAYKQSRSLQITEKNKALANLNINKAIAVCLPSIDAKVNYNHKGLSSSNQSNQSSKSKDTYLNQISLIQPIFNQRTFVLFSQAKINLRAEENNLEEEINTLTLNVKKSFYNLLRSERMTGLSKNAVELMKELLKNAQALYNNGMVVETDVLRAEMELAKAEKNVLTATQSESLARKNLCMTIGIELDTPILLDENLTKPDYALLEINYYKNKAIENRPSLKKTKENVLLAKENVSLNKASFWPVFSAYGNYNWNGDTFLPRDDSWDAGINVTLNVFNGGLNRLEITEAKYKYDQAKNSLWQTEQAVVLEVDSAYSKLTETQQLINVNQKILKIAEENYKLNQKRYAEGLIPNTTVLEAFTSLLEAQINKISAEYDYYIAIAALEKTVGTMISN